MLKVWNVVLIILTYILSLFGTFLTRSGILDSIHAFAEGQIGYYFLIFISTSLLASLGLLFSRLPLLRADNEVEAVLSRESAFLTNNIVFVGMAFAVFWGTVYPIISEAATGQRITVGPPYFNAVIGPILLGMMVLMGIAPLLPWRRATQAHLMRHLVPPTAAGLIAIIVLALLGVRSGVVLLALGIVTFVAVGHLLEIGRGWKAQRQRSGQSSLRALATLIGKNRRRYGGYVIHLGITVMALGIVISSFYRSESDHTVSANQPFTVGPYTLTSLGVVPTRDLVKERIAAPVRVSDAQGNVLAEMSPALDLHFKVPGGQRETEVAIQSFGTEDLYVVMTGVNTDSTVTYKVFREPLIGLVWLGGLILILGSLIVVWPDPREDRILARLHARDAVVA